MSEDGDPLLNLDAQWWHADGNAREIESRTVMASASSIEMRRVAESMLNEYLESQESSS